jgi:hypothetical protein
MNKSIRMFFAVGAFALLSATAVQVDGAQAYKDDKKKPKRPARQRVERPFSIGFEAGVGFDSNAFLAPGAPYTDFAVVSAATGTSPLVTPVVHSGFYIPIRFHAAYDGDPASRVRLLASYRFTNDMYPQSETDNADRFTHKLKAGLEFVLDRKGRREDTLDVVPFVGLHKEIYVDHDTGLDRTSGVNVISNRYNYRSAGLDTSYRNRTAPVPYELRAFTEKRNYEDPAGITTELDNTYTSIGAGTEFQLAKPVELKLNYDYAWRDYDARRALDLNGNLVPNTTRKYTYHKLNASLRNRLMKALVLYLDYFLILRKDEFVGYNDFTENKYRLRTIYDAAGAVRLRAEVSLWTIDFDRAFAFENPTQPRKTYDAWEATLEGEYRLRGPWSLVAGYRVRHQDSTDLRYDYDRYRIVAAVKYEY